MKNSNCLLSIQDTNTGRFLVEDTKIYNSSTSGHYFGCNITKSFLYTTATFLDVKDINGDLNRWFTVNHLPIANEVLPQFSFSSPNGWKMTILYPAANCVRPVLVYQEAFEVTKSANQGKPYLAIFTKEDVISEGCYSNNAFYNYDSSLASTVKSKFNGKLEVQFRVEAIISNASNSTSLQSDFMQFSLGIKNDDYSIGNKFDFIQKCEYSSAVGEDLSSLAILSGVVGLVTMLL